MEFDRDLRARQEVRLLAQQAQLAFEGLQKLDQSGLDRITEALSRAGALHAAELAREACAETGFGNERDKTEKNRFAAVRVFEAIRGLPHRRHPAAGRRAPRLGRRRARRRHRGHRALDEPDVHRDLQIPHRPEGGQSHRLLAPSARRALHAPRRPPHGGGRRGRRVPEGARSPA